MNKVIHENKSFYGRTTTEILDGGYAYVMVSVMEENQDVAIIHDLTVHRDRRGEGLGRMLLEDACEIAYHMGAESVRLSTISGSWLEEWYERHGFRKIGIDDMLIGHVVLEKPCNKE